MSLLWLDLHWASNIRSELVIELVSPRRASTLNCYKKDTASGLHPPPGRTFAYGETTGSLAWRHTIVSPCTPVMVVMEKAAGTLLPCRYRGVTAVKTKKGKPAGFQAGVRIDGQQVSLGVHQAEEKAAAVRDLGVTLGVSQSNDVNLSVSTGSCRMSWITVLLDAVKCFGPQTAN